MVDYGIARAKVLDTIVDAIKWEAPCLRSAAEQEDARRPIHGGSLQAVRRGQVEGDWERVLEDGPLTGAALGAGSGTGGVFRRYP